MRSAGHRLVLAAACGRWPISAKAMIVARHRIVERRLLEGDDVADEVDQRDVGAAVIDLQAERVGRRGIERVGHRRLPEPAAQRLAPEQQLLLGRAVDDGA